MAALSNRNSSNSRTENASKTAKTVAKTMLTPALFSLHIVLLFVVFLH